jgi:hypothetical protein
VLWNKKSRLCRASCGNDSDLTLLCKLRIYFSSKLRAATRYSCV